MDVARRFGGIERFYGKEAFARFQAAHICVIGVGGVGSWVVEALARSAIGTLTLIDLDIIAESNTNRQIMALEPDYGVAKVDALAKRIKAINPLCQVHAIEDFITEENSQKLLGLPYDFVVDCIDNVRVKTAIAAWCVAHHQPFVVSCGAGGQADPTKIQLIDLSQVTNDPLLAKLRYRLRRYHQFSRVQGKKMGVPCVYSTETLCYPEYCEAPQGLSCSGFGALMTVTATFGMVAAAHVLNTLAQHPHKSN